MANNNGNPLLSDEEVDVKSTSNPLLSDEEVDITAQKKSPSVTTPASPAQSTSGSATVSGQQSGSGGEVENNTPIDLPKTYERTEPSTYKNLISGKKYKLTQGGKPIIGTWDESTQSFIKEPLINALPQVKQTVGFAEALEVGLTLKPPVETKEEAFGRAATESDNVYKEVKQKVKENDDLMIYPAVQRYAQLQDLYSKTDDDKVKSKIKAEIERIKNANVAGEGILGAQISTSETPVYTDAYIPELPPYKELIATNEKLPKINKTVGEAYNQIVSNVDFIQQGTKEVSEFESSLNNYLISKLPQDKQNELKEITDEAEYNSKLQEALVESKQEENVIAALFSGLSHKMSALADVGSNLGLDDTALAKKKVADIKTKELFAKQPKGKPAEIFSSVGGMLPDIFAGTISPPLMMGSMMSTMPNDFLEQSIADDYYNGRPIDIGKAKQYAGVSTVLQGGMLIGAGKIGSHGLRLLGDSGKKRVGELLYEIGKRGTKDAVIFGALGTKLQNELNKAYGISENDEYLNAMVHMFAIGGLFAAKEGLPQLNLTSKQKSEIDYISSYLPADYTRKQVKQLIEKGLVTPTRGEEISKKLDDYRTIVNEIPSSSLTYQQMEKIYPSWLQKQELQKKLVGATPEIKNVLSGQISELDRKILIDAAIPLTAEEKVELNRLKTAQESNKPYDQDRLKFLEDRQKAAEQETIKRQQEQKAAEELTAKPEAVTEGEPKTKTDATKTIQQKEGVSAERKTGGEGGETRETGGGDSVQRKAEGAEEGQVAEGGVTAPTPETTTPQAGSSAYRENSSTHIEGRSRERTIADGTKVKGKYKIVSADDVLASHNEQTFAKTEGFPVNEKGKTVNDRDYETDKAAQSEVVRIAGALDERAVSQTPIVTKDGIVVDGNNRTMSRKLAAKQGTDKAYIEALKADADMYGIDPAQIDKVKNPMLVFEADKDIPYTTKEFSRFNKPEKKEKSPIEKAVELSKTISDRARRVLSNIYEGAERASDVTSNRETMNEVRDMLLSEGVLQPNELPRYINPETGTATKEGVSFLETLLMGSALDENTIRMLDTEGMGAAKQRVIESIVQITQNAALGENSLQSNIENGIKLLNKANASKQTVIDVISQMDMFEVSEFSAEDLAVAILLDGKGFKDFLKRYNGEVGTESLFEGTITKEKIIDNLLNQRIKNYEQVRKNLRPDAERRKAEVPKTDGGVEQKATEPTTATTEKVESQAISESIAGFTESKDLNRINAEVKAKYGDKKGSAIIDAAIRLVNPNQNTIVEVRSNGVVVKEGDKYFLKPFTNTDFNYKKWQLGKAIDVTEQFVKEEQPISKPEKVSEQEITLFKGQIGKLNADGTRRTAHPNAEGFFASESEDTAKRYSGEEKPQKITLPKGVTIEEVEVADKNKPMSEIRKEEERLINQSKAQVVKLKTMDAKGEEVQYIVKDKSLLEGEQRPSVKKAEYKIRSESTETGGITYFAYDENGDIGSIDVEKIGDKVIIDNAFVKEKYQRKGIAKSLLEQIKKDFDITEKDMEFGVSVSDEGAAFKQAILEAKPTPSGIEAPPTAEIAPEQVQNFDALLSAKTAFKKDKALKAFGDQAEQAQKMIDNYDTNIEKLKAQGIEPTGTKAEVLADMLSGKYDEQLMEPDTEKSLSEAKKKNEELEEKIKARLNKKKEPPKGDDGIVKNVVGTQQLADIPNRLVQNWLAEKVRNVENYVAKTIQKASVSENAVKRSIADFITALSRGVMDTKEYSQAKRQKLTGEIGLAKLDVEKFHSDMWDLIGGDINSADRVHQVLDPEVSQTGLKYDDLTDAEKELHDLLRDLNDYTHNQNFILGKISQETYDKYKDKYIGRDYVFDDLPDQSIGGRTIKEVLGIYKQRKDLDQVMRDAAVKDPIYLTLKRYLQTAQNKAVADYSDWIFKNHGENNPFGNAVFVSDTPKDGFIKLGKGYGSLSNKYVARNVAEDFGSFIFNNDFMSLAYDAFKAYDGLPPRQFMKELLTVGNPQVQIGNATSNIVFAWLGGVDFPTYISKASEAMRQIKNKGDVYRLLTKEGLLGSDFVSRDLKPMETVIGGEPTTVFGKARKKLRSVYSGVDDAAKIQMYLSLKDMGYTHEEATNIIFESMQNYQNTGRIWDFASKTPIIGNSFVKFTPEMLRLIKNGMTRRPLHTAAFISLISTLPSIIGKAMGDDDEEINAAAKMKGIPKITVPYTDLNIPLSWRIGDKRVNLARFLMPMYIYDIGGESKKATEFANKFIPYQLKETETGGVTPFNVQDPFVAPIVSILQNKDFRDKPIVEETDSQLDGTLKRLRYGFRGYGGFYANMIDDIYSTSVTGEDFYGRRKTALDVALNTLIKVETFDDEKLKQGVIREFDGYERLTDKLYRAYTSKRKQLDNEVKEIEKDKTIDAERKKNLIAMKQQDLMRVSNNVLQEVSDVQQDMIKATEFYRNLGRKQNYSEILPAMKEAERTINDRMKKIDGKFKGGGVFSITPL